MKAGGENCHLQWIDTSLWYPHISCGDIRSYERNRWHRAYRSGRTRHKVAEIRIIGDRAAEIVTA